MGHSKASSSRFWKEGEVSECMCIVREREVKMHMYILYRGQFGVVHDCLHKTTQQLYAARLLPLEVGQDHAQHELEMLSGLDYPDDDLCLPHTVWYGGL